MKTPYYCCVYVARMYLLNGAISPLTQFISLLCIYFIKCTVSNHEATIKIGLFGLMGLVINYVVGAGIFS